MTSIRRALQRTAVLVVVLGAAAAGIWYWTRPQPVPIAVQAVTRGTVESTVANTRAGTVKACRRAGLSPPSGGQMARLLVHEGEHVQKGQILLELWNQDFAARVTLAEREAVAARAQATEACTTAEVAERRADRLTRLRRQGLASEEATDQAVGEAKAQAARCEAGQASAQVSEARIEVAKAELDRTILRAPFAGTVADINGEVGEFVTPSPIGIPTPPAVDLIDTSCLYVSAPIDEVDAPAIRVGMPARITLDAFPKRSFPGRVRRIAPYVQEAEKQARTVDIEVEFTHPEDETRLLPGYSSDAEVVLGVRKDVLRVPTEAVLEGNRVYVYDPESGLISERTIGTGLSNWQYTEVTKGLTSGELVVTSIDRPGLGPGAHGRPEQTASAP